MINHQRIGAISNVHAGGDFETIVDAYFLQFEGLALDAFPRPPFSVTSAIIAPGAAVEVIGALAAGPPLRAAAPELSIHGPGASPMGLLTPKPGRPDST